MLGVGGDSGDCVLKECIENFGCTSCSWQQLSEMLKVVGSGLLSKNEYPGWEFGKANS